MRRIPFLITLLFIGMAGFFTVHHVRAQEAELVIAKYGKLTVKSSLPDAKVYVDDIYKGAAGNVIENIMVGDHIITCRKDAEALTGRFTIRKDETLRLEANFDDNKLAVFVDREKIEKPEKIEKVEAPKPEKLKVEPPKAKVEAPKAEKPKKPVVEVKKEDRKSPEEERRTLHLSMIKAYFDDIDAQEVKIFHKVNPKVVSKFTEKKGHAGTFFRTKKDILLCEKGPCEQQWAVSFAYTDETGRADTIGLTWKQTVFNGMTPAGTNKRDLLYCVGSECKNLEDTANNNTPLAAQIGRYHLTWTKSSLVVRRSDVMREVTAAGGLVEAY